LINVVCRDKKDDNLKTGFIEMRYRKGEPGSFPLLFLYSCGEGLSKGDSLQLAF
jgi:hypothetical protein